MNIKSVYTVAMVNNNGSDDVGSLGEASPVGHLPLALLTLLHLRKTHTVQDSDDGGDGGDDDCTKTHTVLHPDSWIMTTKPWWANVQM